MTRHERQRPRQQWDNYCLVGMSYPTYAPVKLLTKDEGAAIAANIVKLPELFPTRHKLIDFHSHKNAA